MTLKAFVKNLIASGFVETAHPCGYSHYYTSDQRGIVIDNVKGGAYRLFLGLNCIPASYPPTAALAKKQIDAESPWFSYVEKEEKGDALQRCWQWLQTIG